MKKLFKPYLVALLFSASAAHAQNTTLVVGDPAPELRYSKWLGGKPVQSFDKNKMYVLDFWATWCGPCIAAMPKLSEFAKTHPDYTVIALNVWEKVGMRPYESALPNVEKFVKGMGGKMAFNVAVDNNDQYISQHWLRSAGITAIPTTMLVKDGRVIWIGEPTELETVVESVKKGSYNLAAIAKGADEQRVKVASTIQQQKNMMAPYEEAIAAKDYKAAIAALDKLSDHPETDYGVAMKKFTTLLDFGKQKEALQVAKTFLASNTMGGNSVSNFGIAIADRNGLAPETYLFAVECLKPHMSRGAEAIPLVFDFAATCYYKAGDYANAIKNQEIAFLSARDGLAAGKWNGRVTKELVAQYETTLKGYQAEAGLKNKK